MNTVRLEGERVTSALESLQSGDGTIPTDRLLAFQIGLDLLEDQPEKAARDDTHSDKRFVTFDTIEKWQNWFEQHRDWSKLHGPLNPHELYDCLCHDRYVHYRYAQHDFCWEEGDPPIDSPGFPVWLIYLSDEQIAETERLTGHKAVYVQPPKFNPWPHYVD